MIALLKKYFWVLFVSMVPIVELRGAVPIGVGMASLCSPYTRDVCMVKFCLHTQFL